MRALIFLLTPLVSHLALTFYFYVTKSTTPNVLAWKRPVFLYRHMEILGLDENTTSQITTKRSQLTKHL